MMQRLISLGNEPTAGKLDDAERWTTAAARWKLLLPSTLPVAVAEHALRIDTLVEYGYGTTSTSTSTVCFRPRQGQQQRGHSFLTAVLPFRGTQPELPVQMQLHLRPSSLLKWSRCLRGVQPTCDGSTLYFSIASTDVGTP